MRGVPLVCLVLVCAAPAAVAASEVKALGGFFDPDRLQVVVGEEVIWTNEDSMPHTVTSTWDSGASFDAVIRGGETFSWTFNDIGEWVVHCRPHAYPNEQGGMDGMAMTITVGPLESVGNIGGPLQETPAAPVALLLLALLGAAFIPRR